MTTPDTHPRTRADLHYCHCPRFKTEQYRRGGELRCRECEGIIYEIDWTEKADEREDEE